MKELSREQRAVSAFRNAAANFRIVTEDVLEGREDYCAFYDNFTSAVASFMESELNFRQAGRAEILNIHSDLAAYSRRTGETLNRKGILLLENALNSFSIFERQAESLVFDETITDLVDEFDEELKNQLLLLETKASDTEQIYQSFAQVYEYLCPTGSTSSLYEYQQSRIEELISVRSQEGRGAVTNIAWWKVVAIAVTACVSLVSIIRCYALHKCSKKEQAIYNSIIAIAMIVFGACE